MPLPRNEAPPYPDPGGRADRRLRPLSRQGDGRRPRRRVRDGLQGRARHARRLGARARPRRAALRRGAAQPLGNDRYGGRFTVDRPGRWQFAVSAWTDRIATWQDELRRKVDGGQTDLAGELAEGAVLLGRESLTAEEGLAADTGDRHGVTTSQAYEVDVDRELARFGAWYELFPRSFGGLNGVAERAAATCGARLRRRVPAADPPDRPHEPEGQEQRGRRTPRATSARRGRSAPRRAATTRCTRTSGRGRTSTR